jgi:hypothetical protein
MGAVFVVPDEGAARYRRAAVTGPATVVLRYPAAARPARRGSLRLRQSSERPMHNGKRLALKAGQRAVFE